MFRPSCIQSVLCIGKSLLGSKFMFKLAKYFLAVYLSSVQLYVL